MSAQATAARGACYVFLGRGLVAVCVRVPPACADAADVPARWAISTAASLCPHAESSVSACVYLCPHTVRTCQAGRACSHVSVALSPGGALSQFPAGHAG